jgi:hypothetical protein
VRIDPSRGLAHGPHECNERIGLLARPVVWWHPERVTDDPAADRVPYDGGPSRTGAKQDGPGGHVNRRVMLASALATELRDLPAPMWQRQARGATTSHVAFVGDEVELADVVAEAWDVARSQPSPGRVRAERGVSGMVVAAHGDTWSLVARSAGPVLILSDRIAGVLRVDRDPDCRVELSELVSELVNVAQGRPPFDESQIPPMPPLPWHAQR